MSFPRVILMALEYESCGSRLMLTANPQKHPKDKERPRLVVSKAIVLDEYLVL